MTITGTSPSSGRVSPEPRIGEFVATDSVIDRRVPDSDRLATFRARTAAGGTLTVRFMPRIVVDGGKLPDLDEISRRANGCKSVAPIVDTNITSDGIPYIAYEADAESLEEYVSHMGALGLTDALHLGLELARGLQVLHSRGVFHGHLTPANVLRSDFGELLITDIGVVSTITSARGIPPLMDILADKSVIGNIGHMAPEYLGNSVATAATDVYGVGALLHFLLTGYSPHESSDAKTLASCVIGDPPPRVSDIVTSLPSGMDSLLDRMLDKDPKKRCASAGELADELVEALGRIGSRVFDYEPTNSGFVPTLAYTAVPGASIPPPPEVPYESKPPDESTSDSTAPTRMRVAPRSPMSSTAWMAIGLAVVAAALGAIYFMIK